MKRLLLFIAFFQVGVIGLLAQDGTVQGIITDESGETVPGATVLLKGTSTGTVTDLDGNFSLNVSNIQNDILVVSFIGYETMEVPVAGQSKLDIVMRSDVTELQEIVVVGYGVQKKKVVTGAIASIDADEISSTPALRVEQALQGRTPGVQVTNQSGQPGETPTILIRGAGTTGNATPLYVVDGLVLGGIDYLNPGDIESIDVLKDAASAAIYGARAANGVVLITTKSGKEGKLSISYDGYYGIQNPTNTIDMLNADDYRMLQNEGARNAGLAEPFDLSVPAAHNTDWQDALFEKNAPISNHQITIMGGNAKSKFSSSISKFSQQGIIGGEKSQFDRYTARINTTHDVNKMFSFGNNLTYSHIIRRGIGSNQSFNGPFSSALNIDPLTPVFETDPDILSEFPYSTNPVVTDANGNVYGISTNIGAEVVNPLALIENTYAETNVDKLVGNIYGELEPIEGLKIKSSLGTDLAFINDDSFIPIYYLNGAQNRDVSSVSKRIQRYFTWQFENTITYTRKIQEHNFSLLAGMTAQETRFDDLSGFNAGVPTFDTDNVYLNLATDTLDQAGGGAWESSLYSIFGRITYDFKDKYSFTAILRRDGSSKFGPNNRFGLFPSLGAAWVASDEQFLSNLGPVSFLKLRASWGINGSQEIDNYQYVSRINQGRGYIIGGETYVGSSPLTIANLDIQWEESSQLDFAIDFGLLGDRLTGTIDYYVKTTNKLLEVISIPGHVGNDPSFANVGGVENRGIEFALNYRNSVNELNYSIGINGAYNQNEITKIGNDDGFLTGASWAVAGPVTRSEEGLPIAYFWGYKTDGIFQNQNEIFAHIDNEGFPLQPDAVPGDVKFVDVNGDGVIDDDDRTMIGNPTPEWTTGMTLSADYKGFDFSLFLQGAFGQDIFNGISRRDLRFINLPETALDRWTGEGSSSNTPRFTWSDTNNNDRISDLYIENGSYVRVKNVQLGYNLPQSILSKIGASRWRFYLSAENLFTFTGYSGADPEIGAISSFDIGIDRAVYPQAVTYRIGTNLTF